MAELNLTILEIIVLQSGAIILGIAIHFFITSHRNMEVTSNKRSKLQKQFENWKLKYLNETELKDRELAESRMLLKETMGNTKMYKVELDELKARNEELEEQLQQGGEFNDLALKDEEISILHQKLKKAEDNNRHLLKRFDDLQVQNRKIQESLEIRDRDNVNEYVQQELMELQHRLQQMQEQEQNSIAQLNSLHSQNENLKSELHLLQSKNNDLQLKLDSHQSPVSPVPEVQGDYLVQLEAARQNLEEYSLKINNLIGHVDFVKESKEKQQALLKENEQLSIEIQDLKIQLEKKEAEISNVKQKEHLSTEMHSMLDNAYAEFNSMQIKMQKLESEVTASKKVTMEFEDLKEAHYRLTKDYEHQRSKLFSQVSENQKLNAQVNDLENNLEESNFQRQQLQKKVSYLGELNNDLHELSEANKNLETRLKSIGELESRLNMVAEERDKLLGQQESQ
ncbi:MAG: hypothetical protein H0V30_14595 [Chitinophagaceae bacterium]|nr:hypothetical protein [Chitinophagaceae bacterium]